MASASDERQRGGRREMRSRITAIRNALDRLRKGAGDETDVLFQIIDRQLRELDELASGVVPTNPRSRTEPASTQEGPEDQTSNGLRALVIDEKASFCEELKTTLEASGHSVQSTGIYDEAVLMLRRGLYDFVIVDNHLGRPLIPTARELHPHAKIIIISDGQAPPSTNADMVMNNDSTLAQRINTIFLPIPTAPASND